MSQIRQRPGDPVIAPVTVLLGHANDQLLNLCLDSRPGPVRVNFISQCLYI
jgi:hypothetical protein